MEDGTADLPVETGGDEWEVPGAVQATGSPGVFGVAQEDVLSFLNF